MEAFVILFIVIVMVCWACYRRKLSTAAYGIAALDIFLRIVAFISHNIGSNSVSTFLAKFPDSLLWVVDNYAKGLINLFLLWLFVILMIYFLALTVISFIKR